MIRQEWRENHYLRWIQKIGVFLHISLQSTQFPGIYAAIVRAAECMEIDVSAEVCQLLCVKKNWPHSINISVIDSKATPPCSIYYVPSNELYPSLLKYDFSQGLFYFSFIIYFWSGLALLAMQASSNMDNISKDVNIDHNTYMHMRMMVSIQHDYHLCDVSQQAAMSLQLLCFLHIQQKTSVAVIFIPKTGGTTWLEKVGSY